MYLIQVLLDTGDFVRNKDPQNSKTYLLLCYVKQREAVAGKEEIESLIHLFLIPEVRGALWGY